MNNYRRIQGLQAGPEPTAQEAKRLLGYRGDLTPEDLPLEYASWLQGVRFERGGIRKDFGWFQIGTAAAGKVLAILDHKFIIGVTEYQYIVRIYRSAANKAVVERWDGANWVELGTTVEDVQDVYLSAVSIQNALVFADGQRIWKLQEVATLANEGYDFDDGTNEEELIGDDQADLTGGPIQATIAVANAYDETYNTRFSLDMRGGRHYRFDVVLYADLQEMLRQTYEYNGELDHTHNEFLEQTFNLYSALIDGTVLKLTIENFEILDPARSVSEDYVDGPGFTGEFSAATDMYYMPKAGTARPSDGNITFNYHVPVGVVTRVSHYKMIPAPGRDPDDISDWTSIGDYDHDGSTQAGSVTFSVPDTVEGMLFGIRVEMGGVTGTSEDILPEDDFLTYQEGADVVLHGYNLIDQQDDHYGVELQSQSGSTVELGLISAFAPGARFILSFGDRLVALRDLNDPQSLSWSSDGDITDWQAGDSNQISLLDTRGDALDKLQAATTVGQAIAALFRERSIMRMIETGNPLQAVGAVHWIDHLGTDAPFSVQATPMGAIFLGNDMMVYILSQELTQIGQPIESYLRANVLDINKHLIDSAYNPIEKEYILGIPVGGGDIIDELWTFSLAHFMKTGEILWTRREFAVERLGVVSPEGGAKRDPILANDLHEIQLMYREVVTVEGNQVVAYWETPRLNRDNIYAEATLTRFRILYMSDQAVNITLRASGDGGATWSEARDVALVVTGERRKGTADASFYTTGKDLRVRIELPITVGKGVYVTGYRAEVAEREDRGT